MLGARGPSDVKVLEVQRQIPRGLEPRHVELLIGWALVRPAIGQTRV